MIKIVPTKLDPGDNVGVISPSRSLSIISREVSNIAILEFQKLRLKVHFADNSKLGERYEIDSIKKRLLDIHNMFTNKKIKAIFTSIGGYHSIQLLKHIDWNIIKNNPKIFCGYSDTSVLQNAIYTKTGMITYSGPHFSTFGQKHGTEYTKRYFQECCFNFDPYSISSSSKWSDDMWWSDQDNREFITNSGPVIVNEGFAEGTSLGGNLEGLLSLSGTEFFPSLKNAILFIELTENYDLAKFDAILQSLTLQSEFGLVKGLLIGRFQKHSNILVPDIIKVINAQKDLKKIPVVINLDFGHTQPLFTFPIGGEVRIMAESKEFRLEILKH